MTQILTPDEAIQRQLEFALEYVFKYIVENYKPETSLILELYDPQNGTSYLMMEHIQLRVKDILKERHWEVADHGYYQIDGKAHARAWRISDAKEAHSADPA